MTLQEYVQAKTPTFTTERWRSMCYNVIVAERNRIAKEEGISLNTQEMFLSVLEVQQDLFR